MRRRRAKTGTSEQPVMMERAADLADGRPGPMFGLIDHVAD